MHFETVYRSFIHGALNEDQDIDDDDLLLFDEDEDVLADVSEIYRDLVRLFNEDAIRSTFGQATHDRYFVTRRIGERAAVLK
jgi:hypothetical protein